MCVDARPSFQFRFCFRFFFLNFHVFDFPILCSFGFRMLFVGLLLVFCFWIVHYSFCCVLAIVFFIFEIHLFLSLIVLHVICDSLIFWCLTFFVIFVCRFSLLSLFLLLRSTIFQFEFRSFDASLKNRLVMRRSQSSCHALSSIWQITNPWLKTLCPGTTKYTKCAKSIASSVRRHASNSLHIILKILGSLAH